MGPFVRIADFNFPGAFIHITLGAAQLEDGFQSQHQERTDKWTPPLETVWLQVIEFTSRAIITTPQDLNFAEDLGQLSPRDLQAQYSVTTRFD